MQYDTSDLEIDGQISIEQIYSPPERLFAVSRIFANARKSMNLAEQKTFVYALSELKFTEEAKSLYVKLDKKVLANILGIHSDANHLSVDLYDNIKELPQHSYIEINEKDLDLQSSGFVITAITRFKNVLRLRFNEEYMGLFTGLETNYITMWSMDIFQMTSKRTVCFYEYLRQCMDTRDSVHSVRVSVRKFKELFDIPQSGEGSYMRGNGGFDRANFEKYVIDPLCEDMKHCRMIKLIVQPDGKYYVKEKAGNRVAGYRFFWEFSARPGIATAEEVKEIREAVEKDPAVLKVAKDIVNGKKKPKQKKTTFTDFEQRSYDYDELEARLLRMRKGDQ